VVQECTAKAKDIVVNKQHDVGRVKTAAIGSHTKAQDTTKVAPKERRRRHLANSNLTSNGNTMERARGRNVMQ